MTRPTKLLPDFSRRAFLAGALGLTAAGAIGCSGGVDPTKTVTVGSDQSDDAPKQAYAEMLNGFEGFDVKINTVDHETFKEGINNYLQGRPDDIFTWFAGYRARYFAEKGLVADISDVWDSIDGMADSMKNASSTLEGEQIFMPLTYYPWGVFYRPSLFEERGYSEPKTFDEWISLNEDMLSDGLVPIGFANKDGWEAMGMFDMLNLRVNGYDFHVSLLAGDEAWDGEKVKKVFETWGELDPYLQDAPLGRTWQEAAQGLLQKDTGTYLMGMFLQQQFAASEEARDDLDFFIFPEVDSAIGAGVVEAPVDGFMMAAEPRNEAGAKDLLRYLSTPEAVGVMIEADPSVVAANFNADQSNYSPLQKKAVQVMEEADDLSQFLDRDTRPDFASTVIGPAIQSFIREPGSINSILDNVEKQKNSMFAG